MIPREEELREKVLVKALHYCNPQYYSYKKYTVAYCDGLYIIIDIYKYVYVIRPLSIHVTRPKLLDKLKNPMRLPITLFRPPILYGGIVKPQVSGARQIRRHKIKGWIIYFFKGPYKFMDHRRLWIEGECIGLFGSMTEWDALPPEEAIPEMIKLLQKVDEKLRSEEELFW